MRSPVTGIVALILLLLVAIVVYSSLFAVQQTEQALVVRFGKPVDIVTEPGLHVKAPFIDTVIPADKRILGVPHSAGFRPRQQRRASASYLEEEDATGRRVQRDATGTVL
jgi:regulator of protease activity HflC (stomatin/prohibitin superfamily)